ncbi:hypothetical protein Nepgr_011295 [Nepenthes gracilis]|uniref:Secreted protein n=1 Tax=Nepenthes gracilis TaxID=150966 RepID=A0AAD3SF29_NEPGR|nr:hypothetical protein Nepgr_011295 [Nepenthes gracilis]
MLAGARMVCGLLAVRIFLMDSLCLGDLHVSYCLAVLLHGQFLDIGMPSWSLLLGPIHALSSSLFEDGVCRSWFAYMLQSHMKSE